MMRMLSPICKLIVCTCNLPIFQMFFLGTSSGDVIAEEHNPAVPRELLAEVLSLRKDGILMEDIVSRLRSRTVPSGYPYHPWRTLSGTDESSL